MELLFFFIFLALICGLWANKLGRNGVTWGVVALIISPLLAALLLLVLGKPSEKSSPGVVENEVDNIDAQSKKPLLVKRDHGVKNKAPSVHPTSNSAPRIFTENHNTKSADQTQILRQPDVARSRLGSQLYQKIAPELLAVCLTAEGRTIEKQIEEAMLIVEHDEFIFDKKTSLESLASNLELLTSAHEKSEAIYKLKVSPIIHQVSEIDAILEKERIVIFVDAMIAKSDPANNNKIKNLADKIKQNLNIQSEFSKQDLTESYIRRSGNVEAMNMLNNIKNKPGGFAHNLKQAANDNTVMRTALGVFTGMIAANLVTGAINQYRLDQALADFNAEIENLGGLDNLDISSYQTAFDYTEGTGYSDIQSVETDYTDVGLVDSMDDNAPQSEQSDVECVDSTEFEPEDSLDTETIADLDAGDDDFLTDIFS